MGNDTKMYCAPCNASVVLVIDTESDTSSTITLPEDFTAVEEKFRGVALAPRNGKLYCAPYNASVVLEIDPEKGVTSILHLDKIYLPKKFKSVKQKFHDIALAPHNGHLY